MSDQPSPPQELRLKLKPRPEKTGEAPPPEPPAPPPSPPKADDPAPPPDSTAAPPAAQAPGVGPGKIRLRPRMPIKPAENEPPPAEAPTQPVESSAAPAPAEAPGLAADKIKLRPRLPTKPTADDPLLPALPALPPVPKKVEAVPTAPPLPPKVTIDRPPVPAHSRPPMPGERPAAGAPVAPPVIGREEPDAGVRIRLRSGPTLVTTLNPPAGGEAKARSAAVEKQTAKSGRDHLGAIARVVGVLLVLAVVYLGYRRVSSHRASSSAPEDVPSASVPAKASPTAVTALGRAVQKTRETVAASENRTIAANEALGTVPASPVTAAPAGPSPRFRTLVDRLKISGVRVGPPARLFVGGVTYQEGDVIDDTLGIVFVGVDAKTSELLFKDGAGAVVRRPF